MSDTIPSDMPQKQCTRCKESFPSTRAFFWTNNQTKDHLAARCKKCFHIRNTKPSKGYKHCPRCNQDLPQTTEYFYASNKRRDRLAPYCKECQRIRQLEFYQNTCKNGEKAKPETMICGRCGIEKPAIVQYFSMNPVCRYGLNTICKICTNRRAIQLNRRDPEKTRATWRKHYRQGILYYKNRYHQKRTQILAQQHAFKQSNPERVREWKQRYAHTDRGRRTHLAVVHRRRAQLFAVNGTFDAQEIEQQRRRQKNKCYYCKQLLKKYHIEHVVPLSRGGSNDISNIVISCPTCNWRKGNKLPHEWAEGGHLL